MMKYTDVMPWFSLGLLIIGMKHWIELTSGWNFLLFILWVMGPMAFISICLYIGLVYIQMNKYRERERRE